MVFTGVSLYRYHTKFTGVPLPIPYWVHRCTTLVVLYRVYRCTTLPVPYWVHRCNNVPVPYWVLKCTTLAVPYWVHKCTTLPSPVYRTLFTVVPISVVPSKLQSGTFFISTTHHLHPYHSLLVLCRVPNGTKFSQFLTAVTVVPSPLVPYCIYNEIKSSVSTKNLVCWCHFYVHKILFTVVPLFKSTILFQHYTVQKSPTKVQNNTN